MAIATREITGAMILAAGKGTRLSTLTDSTPKVLLPVANFPILEWILAWLRNYGISEIAINLHHLSDRVQTFLGDGSRFGIKVHCSYERELLGTALGAKKMAQYLGEDFVVCYGDVLTDLNLTDMIRYHFGHRAIATLALFPVSHRNDVGVVTLDKENKVTAFTEKAGKMASQPVFANGGIYIMNKAVFNFVDRDGYMDFGNDVLPRLVMAELPVYGFPIDNDDYLLDIGTLERYRKANEDTLAGKVKINL